MIDIDVNNYQIINCSYTKVLSYVNHALGSKTRPIKYITKLRNNRSILKSQPKLHPSSQTKMNLST